MGAQAARARVLACRPYLACRGYLRVRARAYVLVPRDGDAWCVGALAARDDERRGAHLHEEPLRSAMERDGRGPREVVQLEPRLHRSDHRAFLVDVHRELPHERGDPDLDADVEPHWHGEDQVRHEAFWVSVVLARVAFHSRLVLETC